MRKMLPIGNDQFDEVCSEGAYYVDKSLMIRDFLEYREKAALITRPRRFGKTLNMTMLREFFDITKDSRKLFEGLKIMDTEYAGQMNTRPVIYFSFKDCSGESVEELVRALSEVIYGEYRRYMNIFEKAGVDFSDLYYKPFVTVMQKLQAENTEFVNLTFAISRLLTAAATFYGVLPILLIDEYDQPILASYQYGYHERVREFFASFYGSALKSNEYLGQALLTGIQRVAKESIFSRLNNIRVYTVLDKKYSEYFGLTEKETRNLLEYYNLELNQSVKEMYDGYLFGGQEIYNPWSVLMYADSGVLNRYWVNTSTNYLIHKAVREASNFFKEKFEVLIQNGEVRVGINLETSFLELANDYALWGLFVNSGYLRINECNSMRNLALVSIPNREVKTEFQTLAAEYTHIEADSLEMMFSALLQGDMEEFFGIYKRIVLNCTSYYDAKENAYHMLFLGMCISLDGIYRITSNLESGTGRSDIRLEAKEPERYPHLIIEFKQGSNLRMLADEALGQIRENRYDTGLSGEIWCLGIAHDKKTCEMSYEKIYISQ